MPLQGIPAAAFFLLSSTVIEDAPEFHQLQYVHKKNFIVHCLGDYFLIW